MTCPKVSRRTVAKGVAWSVPAVAAAQAVPSFAASGNRESNAVGGSVCEIFYGGGSQSTQRMSVYLMIDYTKISTGTATSPQVIPAGTTVTWNVTMDASTSYSAVAKYTQVPNVNYSKKSDWKLTVNPKSGTNTSSFTVTWTANQDVNPSAFKCNCNDGAQNEQLPALIWPDSGGPQISPGVTVTVSSTSSVPAKKDSSGNIVDGATQTSSLSWKVPRRRSTSKAVDYATVYLSKSGQQTKWPSTKYAHVSGSTASMGTAGSTCKESGGNNSSTIFPDGTCSMVQINSGNAFLPSSATCGA